VTGAGGRLGSEERMRGLVRAGEGALWDGQEPGEKSSSKDRTTVEEFSREESG